MEEKSKIAERLAHFLKEKGKTQRKVSKQLKVSPKTISELAAGKRTLRYVHALALQAFYGLNSKWLLTGEGVMMLPFTHESFPFPTAASPITSQTIFINKSDQVLHEIERFGTDIAHIGEELRDIRSGQRIMEERMVLLDKHIGTLDTRLMTAEKRLIKAEQRLMKAEQRLETTEHKAKSTLKRVTVLEKSHVNVKKSR